MDRRAGLESILALTRTARTLAGDGAWEEVEQVQSERRDLIERFFERPAQAHETIWMRPMLREIIAVDAELVRLAEDARTGLGSELYQARRRRKAREAYTAHSGA